MQVTAGKTTFFFVRGFYRGAVKTVARNKNGQETVFTGASRYDSGIDFVVPGSWLTNDNLPATVKFYAGDRQIGNETLTLPAPVSTGGGSGPAVDLTPVINRIEALETAVPAPVDLTPIQDKLDELEASIPPPVNLAPINTKLTQLEQSIPAPIDLAPITARLLPEGGTTDMVLSKADPAENKLAKWVAPSVMAKYRGNWNAPQLLRLIDMTGTDLTLFTAVGTSIATLSTAAMDTHAGTNKPAFQNMLRVTATSGTGNQRSGAQLDMTALNLPGAATKISWWESVSPRGTTGQTGAVGDFLEAGNTRYSSVDAPGPTAWVERSVNLTNGTPLIWQVRNVANIVSGSQYNIAGIRILGSVSPYMYGDVVDYKGSLYRSEINNNANTPGGAGWTNLASSGPEYAGARTGAWDNSLTVYNGKDSIRRQVRAVLAQAFGGTSLVPVLCVGDSETAGWRGTPGLDDPVTTVRNLFRKDTYPVTNGWLFPNNGNTTTDTRISFTGAWSGRTTTVSNYVWTATQGNTITFAPDLPGTIAEFVVFTTATQDITYSIDGGAETTYNVVQGALRKVQITGLTAGTHTIRITKAAATGTMWIGAARVRNATGLSISNAGVFGAFANDWLPSALSGVYYNPYNLTSGLEAPKLVIIGLGANEALNTGSPVTVAARLTTIVQAYQSQGAVVVLKTYMPTTDTIVSTANPGYVWTDYVKAFYDVTDATGTMLIDHTGFGDPTVTRAQGLMYTDNIHPLGAGYIAIGRRDYNALSNA